MAPLQSVFTHQGQVGSDKRPFVVRDIGGVRRGRECERRASPILFHPSSSSNQLLGDTSGLPARLLRLTEGDDALGHSVPLDILGDGMEGVAQHDQFFAL